MPTPIFACGGECRLTATGSASGTAVKHWDSGTGTFGTSTSIFRGNGLASLQFTSSGVRSSLDKTVASLTTGVARFYIRFGTLPNIDTTLMGFMNGSNAMGIKFKSATGTIVGLAGAVEAGSVAVVVNTWYRIDLKVAGLAGTTHTTDWSVDGVAQTQAARTTTAGVLDTFRIGTATATTAVTATVYYDDVLLSATSGDYPLGAGSCVGLFPSADGTHSFNAATDFKVNNTTNIAVGATTTWNSINHGVNVTTPFLAAAGAATGEYLEWTFPSLPGTVLTVNGLEVVTAHYAAGTLANTQTVRLVDGGTTNDVTADQDFSVTGNVVINSKHYATAPSSGVAWTITKVNALKMRWASSFVAADISPVPFINAVVLEVDFSTSASQAPITFQTALACYGVDAKILFNITPLARFSGGSGFVHQMGAGGGSSAAHRFCLDEITDT